VPVVIKRLLFFVAVLAAAFVSIWLFHNLFASFYYQIRKITFVSRKGGGIKTLAAQ